jgi:hypothetical protein
MWLVYAIAEGSRRTSEGVMPENAETIEEMLLDLHRSGWSIGSTAFATPATGLVWVVSGRNGENVIRSARRSTTR